MRKGKDAAGLLLITRDSAKKLPKVVAWPSFPSSVWTSS